MKEMAEQAELMGRKVNHSTRKTFACTLLQADRPNTEVAQLGFWKSVATFTHYNAPSFKQQNTASNILSDYSTLKIKKYLIQKKVQILRYRCLKMLKMKVQMELTLMSMVLVEHIHYLENIMNYSANY